MSARTGPSIWRVGHGRTVRLDEGPLIMGIVNVTPDSFSDGGLFLDPEAAVRHGLAQARAGADILDIGGESARPGSQPVAPDEQIRRIGPVVQRLADQCGALLSVDTRSAHVAQAAVDAGAHIVNDISAMRDDPDMAAVVSQAGAGVVLMHMQGTPATMQDNPAYRDVVEEVRRFLADRIECAVANGIERACIAVDPGIGFGKDLGHNLELLAHLDRLADLGCPVLVGPSRKRFIGELLGVPVNERLAGTLAACVLAAARGASILRVHDPGPVRQAVQVAHAILRVTEPRPQDC